MRRTSDGDVPPTRRVTSLYFRAAGLLLRRPVLVLNGPSHGRVLHLANLAAVVAAYRPPDEDLVVVTVAGTPRWRGSS